MLSLLRWFTGAVFGLLVLSAETGTDISFERPLVFTVDAPAALRTLLSGDWNGDGKIDLAAQSGQSLWIFEGDGAGGFRPALEIPLGPAPIQIAAADFNSDGRTDLLVYQCSDEVPRCIPSGDFSVFLSDGDFRFTSLMRYRPAVSTADGPPGGPYVLGFVVADLNADGTPDLLLTLNPPGRDSVVLGRGDGSFANPIRGPQTFTLVGVADFNSDGVPDVMTQDLTRQVAQIHYGRGDGTLQNPVAFEICSSSCLIQITDLDSDGVPDLLVADTAWGWTGNWRIFRGNGRGGFDPLTELPDSLADHDRQGFALAFADLNADRIPDLIRTREWHVEDGSDNVSTFYKGNGKGEFALSAEVLLPYQSAAPLLVDVNGDGKPDLIATDGAQNLLVFLNSSH